MQNICLVAVVACLGWAGFEYSRGEPQPGLAVEPLELTLDGPILANTQRVAMVRLVNRSPRMVRVIGLEAC